MQTPHLIQRCEIRRPLGEGKRFSDAVSCDYMGSTEFEWGALPNSLRALQSNVDAIKLTVDPRIKDGERSIRVLHTFDDKEFEEYFVYLQRMRKDDLRGLKELTYFQEGRSKYQEKIDLWWDVVNHVMWSFDKPFMNRLGDALVESWKYMDEQKALREAK